MTLEITALARSNEAKFLERQALKWRNARELQLIYALVRI